MRHLVTTAVLFLVGLPMVHAAYLTPSMLDPTVTQVAAGSFYTCALTPPGSVECWGQNSAGQLGNGSTSDAATPIAVSGLTDAVAIAAGSAHACAVTVQGFVRCWGNNTRGQLGNGTNTNQSTPVATIVGSIASLAAGGSHTCGLTSGSVVLCWGYNAFGQLGDGTLTNKNAPGLAVIGLTDVVAITAGTSHTCALTRAGAVKCWGSNVYGQLGDGTTTDSATPVAVIGLGSGVAAIAAASRHTCALTRVGTVKCWGYNSEGELGNGITTNSPTPVAVSGLSNVASIAATNFHTCALVTTGTVKCWGQNFTGQLGNGTTTVATVPVAVSGLSDVVAIAAGGYHTCAQSTLGGLTCWGFNSNGQLGDSTMTDTNLPVEVYAHNSSVVTAIATGAEHTCALTAAGTPRCWGKDLSGQLGDGAPVNSRSAPTSVSGLLSGIAIIAPGFRYSCAVTVSGGVLCWGSNFYGTLGNPGLNHSYTPVEVSGLASGVAAIATSHSGSHTCVRTTAGAVKCWGVNGNGQLGDGTQIERDAPISVSGLGSGVAAIAAGTFHTCALTTTGAVQCWGKNDLGQLGDGTQTDRSTPVPVTGMGSGIAAIATGDKHTCALTTAGAVKCWGSNSNGQIAAGNLAYTTTPIQPTGLTAGISAIAAGSLHTCVITTGGALKCFGANARGQIGDGSLVDRNTPFDVLYLDSGVVAVDAGYQHTCALTAAKTVLCWGGNDDGQLAVDSIAVSSSTSPEKVRAGRSITFEPLARAGLGASANFASLFATANPGILILDTWTPDTCSVSNNILAFNNTGLCGVRVSAYAETFRSTPPQQLRLIQVENDLIFASGLDIWGGFKH
ncbi:RCC1 domain-containing protein [Pseudolysobacter antarcticus]|nr:RCC1 repeat-containing protein [Pseudolysobacter antarcticus]